MEIPPVRDKTSISREDSVMPMGIFVICVDDFGTLRRFRAGLDPACFPPGSFSLLSVDFGR